MSTENKPTPIEDEKSPCPIGHTRDNCPYVEETYSGMDGERYRCSKCPHSYFIDYEEIK
jgi:hypothetical protein